jgi:hypothetical protein
MGWLFQNHHVFSRIAFFDLGLVAADDRLEQNTTAKILIQLGKARIYVPFILFDERTSVSALPPKADIGRGEQHVR